MRTRSREYGSVTEAVKRCQVSTAPALRRSRRLARKARVIYYAERCAPKTLLANVPLREAARLMSKVVRTMVSWTAKNDKIVQSQDQRGLIAEVMRAQDVRMQERVRRLEGLLEYRASEKMSRLTRFLSAISNETLREVKKVWAFGPVEYEIIQPASGRRHFGMLADEAAALELRYLHSSSDSDSDSD